jgi:hypothetical protein
MASSILVLALLISIVATLSLNEADTHIMNSAADSHKVTISHQEETGLQFHEYIASQSNSEPFIVPPCLPNQTAYPNNLPQKVRGCHAFLPPVIIISTSHSYIF